MNDQTSSVSPTRPPLFVNTVVHPQGECSHEEPHHEHAGRQADETTPSTITWPPTSSHPITNSITSERTTPDQNVPSRSPGARQTRHSKINHRRINRSPTINKHKRLTDLRLKLEHRRSHRRGDRCRSRPQKDLQSPGLCMRRRNVPLNGQSRVESQRGDDLRKREDVEHLRVSFETSSEREEKMSNADIWEQGHSERTTNLEGYNFGAERELHHQDTYEPPSRSTTRVNREIRENRKRRGWTPNRERNTSPYSYREGRRLEIREGGQNQVTSYIERCNLTAERQEVQLKNTCEPLVRSSTRVNREEGEGRNRRGSTPNRERHISRSSLQHQDTYERPSRSTAQVNREIRGNKNRREWTPNRESHTSRFSYREGRKVEIWEQGQSQVTSHIERCSLGAERQESQLQNTYESLCRSRAQVNRGIRGSRKRRVWTPTRERQASPYSCREGHRLEFCEEEQSQITTEIDRCSRGGKRRKLLRQDTCEPLVHSSTRANREIRKGRNRRGSTPNRERHISRSSCRGCRLEHQGQRLARVRERDSSNCGDKTNDGYNASVFPSSVEYEPTIPIEELGCKLKKLRNNRAGDGFENDVKSRTFEAGISCKHTKPTVHHDSSSQSCPAAVTLLPKRFTEENVQRLKPRRLEHHQKQEHAKEYHKHDITYNNRDVKMLLPSKCRNKMDGPRKPPWGYRRLQQLAQDRVDAEDLAVTLMSGTKELSELVSAESLKPDWVKLLLQILAKACRSSAQHCVLTILNTVVQSPFLLNHVLESFILKRVNVNDSLQTDILESVENLLEIVKKAFLALPSFSQKYEMVLILLETLLLKHTSQDSQELLVLQGKIQSLKGDVCELLSEKRESEADCFSSGMRKQRVMNNPCELLPPPSDFRHLPICPTHADVFGGDVYLRANKEIGQFNNTSHYLDVQFRLLREDFILPLREGIAEYLDNLKTGKPERELNDIRMYTGVRIISPKCSPEGVLYRVQFEVNGKRHIRWQFSKRLIYGSLLCLSHDNFNTVIFATVVGRDIEDLQAGFVHIKFVDYVPDNRNAHQTFLMVETSAYFEAYKHVLAGLQELNEEIPFQRYIVNCETEVRPPRYLSADPPSLYDLSAVTKPDVAAELEIQADSVPILTSQSWPSVSSFHLDESQLQAVKTALTKEFAIIQGPPGTGKTFVGAQIVRILLANKEHWGPRKPILVLCYTNHALDQFLEKLLAVGIRGILRVGGRSRCESLERFTMAAKRQYLRSVHGRDRKLLKGARHCRGEMLHVKDSLEFASVDLDISKKGILKEQILREYMSEDQYESLVQPGEDQKFSIMCSWLKLGIQLYGEVGERFGESKVFSLKVEHIEALISKLKTEEPLERTEQIRGLEQTLHLLEEELEEDDTYYFCYRYEEGNHLDLADRWCLYKQFRHRLKKSKELALQRTQRLIVKKEEQQEMSPENCRRQNFAEGKSLEDIEGLNQEKARIECFLASMNDGILLGSVLTEVGNSTENLSFLSREDKDRYFMARWLGFGAVIDLLLQETKLPIVKEYVCEEGELVEHDDNEEINLPEEVEDDDFGMSFVQTRKRYDKISTERAANNFAVETLDKTESPAMASAQKQMIEQITRSAKMTKEEAEIVSNLWKLSLTDRYRLYSYWLSLYRQDLKDRIREFTQQYSSSISRLREVQNEEDYRIMRDAKVIGITTTGAAKHRHVLQRVQAPVVIVEEAAEILEAHVISALNPGCQHLILIGDHKQLKPSTTTYELAKNYKLNVSLFERMVNNGIRCDTLQLQRRMRPEIADLVRLVYPELENHESVLNMEAVKGVGTDLFFIDHTHPEEQDKDTKSKSNAHEANFVAALCKYLVFQGYEPSQITVLTSYRGQVLAIKSIMRETVCKGVKTAAVDDYQGEENDIILLSLVRSNNTGSVGFLNVDNRVCVALSRARQGLYVIGNFSILAEKSRLWSKMINMLKSKTLCGPALELYCQNHPNLERVWVTTGEDFKNSPEGGCLRPCAARLPCGHRCPRSCHIMDSSHINYKCKKRCAKKCSAGHRCQNLCFQDCGKCMVVVKKILPLCGHEQDGACHLDPSSIDCKTYIDTVWPCGHSQKTLCADKKKEVSCPKPCKAKLDCGHLCTGTCGECLQGRLHRHCTRKCSRILVCGHECTDRCSRACPPCQRRCENRCVHSQCKNKCGEPCTPCAEPCPWRCEHHECTKLCHEPCDRPPCNEPCTIMLPCGHRCIGLCGEECPPLCRICDKDKVCEIFFGEEDEKAARFIILEQCEHVMEVSGMDRWMTLSSSEDSKETSVQLKACPKCKQTIWKSLRYGSAIKQAWNDISEVKKKIKGDTQEINRKRREVINKLCHSGLSDEIRQDLINRLGEPLTSFELHMKKNHMPVQLLWLEPNKPSTLHQLHVIENQIPFLKTIADIVQKTQEETKSGRLSEENAANMVKDVGEVKRRVLALRSCVSDQQLRETRYELLRIDYLLKFSIYEYEILKTTTSARLDAVQNVLQKLDGRLPFTEDVEKQIIELEETLKKEIPLGLSDIEKRIIVKAMGFQKGHWFKCPNGHFYAIGECGGAMVESTCPECKAKIGGTHHTLRGDNHLAPEMDGARFAAWSDQANMGNYDLDRP